MKKKIILKLSSIEKKRLEKIEKNEIEKNTQSIKVLSACDVVLLYDKYNDIEKVAEETGVSRRSVYNYLNRYIEDKDFMLKNKSRSTLENYLNIIEENFYQNPITSYAEAVSRIKKITGIQLSRTQVYYFLKNHNYIKENGIYIKNKFEFSVKVDNLLEYKDIILKFMDNNPTAENRVAINRIRREFPLIKESDQEIEDFLKKHWCF